MFAIRIALITIFISISFIDGFSALPQQLRSGSTDELLTCAQQLSKYRKFMLQAILSFEDVCDAYNTDNSRQTSDQSETIFPFHNRYQPTQQQQQQIWAFFKLLMAQFNDVEYTGVIRDAVIERCQLKSQMQRDEKRNPSGLVLGKKQRFHSWGGKRSQGNAAPASGSPSINLLEAAAAMSDY